MNRTILLSFILLFLISNNCFAQDKGRIDELEKRVIELEEQLSNIQALFLAIVNGLENNSKINAEDPEINEELKKKWRTLATDMSPKQVRSILGEPEKLNGGSIATWYYPEGSVTFMRDKVQSWEEPNF